MDSSSESESESGRHSPAARMTNGGITAAGVYNGAFLDDASSTISDELFKSTSEGADDNNSK